MTPLKERLHRWQQLDRQTRELEEAVLQQAREHASGGAEPPAAGQFVAIDHMRAAAHEALVDLLASPAE